MNFALILFVLTVLSGIAWTADRLVFRKQRQAAATEALREFDTRRAEMQSRYGVTELDQSRDKLAQDKLRYPWWLEYTAGFFPVILAVFVLRSFIAEPFKIPSGSMIPTLQIGDFILVNKFTYGIRLPVINKKIIDVSEPQRGDVMVFRYPKDESMDYIKRVVGVPGDVIRYDNKRVTLNGKPLEYQALPDFLDENTLAYAKQYTEQLSTVPHKIIIDTDRSSQINTDGQFPYNDNCQYSPTGVTCKVPAGHYFMMGDNRDNSADSRFWGFVPEKNIVGKAFFVWLNLSNFKRIGGFQ
jgi:signal peptidase I